MSGTSLSPMSMSRDPQDISAQVYILLKNQGAPLKKRLEDYILLKNQGAPLKKRLGDYI